ncbi:MAG: CBS domain-containing protein [Cyanobacteria bacterium P01_A01_bin.135]
MTIPAEATVREVMTPDPITVTPDTPLRQAIELLANRRISGLPVLKEDSTLAGVISEAELMWQESGVNRPPYITLLDSVIFLENPATYEKELHKALGQQVKDVMSEKVTTIAPDTTLREAARLMHRKEVPRLIVVDPNAAPSVVGIITRGDVIRYMASHQDDA